MSSPDPRIVYSPHYDISFFGLERMHPFDSRKYGRAWRQLHQQLGRGLKRRTLTPAQPVSRNELLRVHTPAYLAKLHDPKYVAGALELPLLRRAPAWLLDWRVLRPMRWATAGTILAARAAVECGLAVNLSGGYHHARPDKGEGFCIYADIALAIDALRRSACIAETATVLYVDCDAHQGNGVCHCFFDDRRVFVFDVFNQSIHLSSPRREGQAAD